MSFVDTQYLWLIPVVLIVTAIALFAELRRERYLGLFVEPSLSDQLTRLPRRGWRIAGVAATMTAAAFIAMALMRPQWGVIPEERTSKGLDIVIALDLSRSMLADDIQPSRLAVAKLSIDKLLGNLSGDRIGVVGFAGTAFILCPLTSDYAIVRRILDDVGPDSIPLGGSSISSALNEAQRAFLATPKGGRILVLVTDGEDHAGGIATALQHLQREDVAVVAALVGTDSGGLIPLPGGNFVKDRQGAVVKSRASFATVKEIDPAAISLQPGGTSLELLLQRARSTGIETMHKERRHRRAERFQIPLVVSIILLALASVLGRGIRT